MCIFCNFYKNRSVKFIAEYTYCFVVEDAYPVSPGHLLIIPKEHVSDWFAAPIEVKQEIIVILDDLKNMLDTKCKPDGYNIGANCGRAAGQSIDHLHVHLIPRYTGDMQNPKGGVRGVIPKKQGY